MAVTQVSDLNSLFNLIYERARFVARHQNLMANLVDNKSANGWMDRKVNTRPAVTAVSVGETQDYNNPTTFGLTNLATLTPGEVIAQVTLTDRDMETDPDSAVQDAEFEMGGAIATKIDVDLLSTFASFTTDKGSAGAAMTMAKFAAANAVVTNNKARQFGGLNAVLHPYHWHDIWVELGQPAATYSDFSEVTVEALRDYYVDRLVNVSIYTSGNISVDGSDDAVSAVFGTRAIMLDTRRAFRGEHERDASARAWELNATAGYAYGIVHDAEGVKITADATEPA